MTQSPIIYFIDDSPVDLLIGSKIMERSAPQSKVYTFETVDKALTALKTLHADPATYPSFIFLDINMPLQDGWDFLKQFTALPCYPFNGCKVVMLSSSIDPRDQLKSESYACVVDFITKPFLMEHASLIGKY